MRFSMRTLFPVFGIILFLCAATAFGQIKPQTGPQTEPQAANTKGAEAPPADSEAIFLKAVSTTQSPEAVTAVYEKLLAQVSEQIDALPKKFSKDTVTEENKAALFNALHHARVLAWVALSQRAAKDVMPEKLAALRDIALSFLRHSKDVSIREALAGMVSFGFPYLVKSGYQSVRIIRDLAGMSYSKQPTPLNTLAIGVGYINATSNKYGQQIFSTAETYLKETIALDSTGPYGYLATVYLAVLNYKVRNTDKAREYLGKAKQIYPDGAFVNVVNDFYFAKGKNFTHNSFHEDEE